MESVEDERRQTRRAYLLRRPWVFLWLSPVLAAAMLWLPPVQTRLRRLSELHAEAGLGGIRLARVATTQRIEPSPGAGSGTVMDLYDPPGDPRGAIVLVHGNRSRGSQAPLYRLLATKWREAGFRVYGANLEGFGASAPLRPGGDVADRLTASLQAALDEVERREPNLGLCLFGHSLGARLVLRAEPGPRWHVAAFEPGGILDGQPAQRRQLGRLREHLHENLRTATRETLDVGALYAQTPDTRQALQGRAVVLHGSWGTPGHKEAVTQFALATTGRAPVWLPNHDHDLNVLALDGYVLYPASSVAPLVDAVVRECGFPGPETGRDDP